jgi:hypothetical protein
MPLVKAVVAGATAALAIPFLTRGAEGGLSEWASYGVVHATAGGFHLTWSWPIFCIVTLFTWGLLAWSNR